ncbi:MAG: hypothetical protein Greene041619_595 [Candidatus Peregrinibacteria bacterium Greene0416_19]|nr:MAG: hypothetical protein Greene041619_595 [Candidatus Peregrinibacteria bacterium Greene0416_19]
MPPHTHTRRRYGFALSFIEYMTTLPYSELFGLWVGMVILFGLLYCALSFVADGAHSISGIADLPPARRLLNSIYFSTITATTVGYGDFVPLGGSKLLAITQSIFSFFGAGIFVAKLVSHRQEVALEQVHRLSFENLFHKTREGFFIIRRDFEAVLRETAEQGAPSDRSWANMGIACHAFETFLEEIPHFYSIDHELYTIDAKRESLLFDAVFRTLERLRETLTGLDRHGVDWRSRRETRSEIEEFLEIMNQVLPLWQERSPHGNAEGFARMSVEAERLRGMVERR